MSSEPRNHGASDLQEAEEEAEVLKLEEEVKHMAQKILELRTTLPDKLSSTLSSLLVSQRPVLPVLLTDEGIDLETGTLPGPHSESGVAEGLMRQNMGLSVEDETEKIQLLKQKISNNNTELPLVLNKMKECMARIDKLESSNVIIHPAFKRK